MHLPYQCIFFIAASSFICCAFGDDSTQEIQHAVCKIITEKGQTSANATVTRKLKGVCTFNQIELKFAKLEKKLISELAKIKKALGVIDDLKPTESSDLYDYPLYEQDPVVDEDIPSKNGRDSEIFEFNDTISKNDKVGNVYTYYWDIENISLVLSRSGIHIRSPDFYVLGHQLCLQVYPNYLETKSAGFQLRPSTNFMKKHKFIILDPSDSRKDQESSILGGPNNLSEDIFTVSNSLLEENVISDQIYVKVLIFLDT